MIFCRKTNKQKQKQKARHLSSKYVKNNSRDPNMSVFREIHIFFNGRPRKLNTGPGGNCRVPFKSISRNIFRCVCFTRFKTFSERERPMPLADLIRHRHRPEPFTAVVFRRAKKSAVPTVEAAPALDIFRRNCSRSPAGSSDSDGRRGHLESHLTPFEIHEIKRRKWELGGKRERREPQGAAGGRARHRQLERFCMQPVAVLKSRLRCSAIFGSVILRLCFQIRLL